MQPVRMERGAYALGVGLVEMRADSPTGSSGGFLDGLTLVEARVESDERPGIAFEDSAGRRLFEAQLPAGRQDVGWRYVVPAGGD